MKLVVIESPFRGHPDGYDGAVKYLKRAILDSLQRGEAPFALHMLYGTVLDDTNEIERAIGMNAGFVWGAQADLVAVYTDFGTSEGMQRGLEVYAKFGIPVEHRTIGMGP